jgi:phospholipase A1/A2
MPAWMSRFAALLVGLPVTVTVTVAEAGPDPAAAQACVAFGDATARLACYDRAMGRAIGQGIDRTTPAAGGSSTAAQASAPADAAVTPPSAERRAPHPDLLRLAPTLDRQWDLDRPSGADFAPRPYRAVYLLPATWTDRTNHRPSSPSPGHSSLVDLGLKSVESKYQISLKARFASHLLGTPLSLWGGYTQSSRWQVYNGAESRPFRETNYEPEVMLVWPLHGQVLGWQLRMASLSLNHQSNGRSLPLSRSWNRVIATLAAERGEWVAEFRPWVRLQESAESDDNPDIADHVGRAEVRISRDWGERSLSLQLRHSLRSGARAHGSAQLDWVFPIAGALHGYLQVFSGHGESLVDYNVGQTKLGLGVTIAGWR